MSINRDDCELFVEIGKDVDFVDCEGDGHFMCNECAHRARCLCGNPTAFGSHRCEKCDEVIWILFH